MNTLFYVEREARANEGPAFRASRGLQSESSESPGDLPHLRLVELLRLFERGLDSDRDEVLEHLDVARIARLGFDADRLDLLDAVGDDRDEASSRHALDHALLEVALDPREVLLHA